MKESYLGRYGARLLQQGYPIVPIKPGFKFPKGIKDWEKIEANEQQLDKWLANGFAKGGVGVLCKNTPAIDIDIQDAEIVQQLVDYCELNFGATVQRIGNAPKTLLVYRTEDPFTKLTSKKYEDFLGMEHKLEILGNGQQFVAFAVHPETKKPYLWESDTLADINQADLPIITLEEAQGLINYFESIVPSDWSVVEHGQTSQKIDYSLTEEERVLLNIKPKLNISEERLTEAVNTLDPDMRMNEWVKVGMALFHQFDGEETGFNIWDEWSVTGDKYNGQEMRDRWRSFRADLTRQEPVTAATILRQARLSDEQGQGDLVGNFLDQYVYVQDGDRVCDLKKPPHCCVSRLTEFKNRTMNIRHEVSAPTARNKTATRMEAVWKTWMVEPKRKSSEGTTYVPNQGRLITDDYGLDWVNEFHMPEITQLQGRDNLAVFDEHMEYLFPVEVEREWFIDWMAFNLQYPHKRCKVAPLHVSIEHGTGRGWVVELIGKLLGQWNCTKTKMDTLSGEGSAGAYQDYLNKSLMCAIEEVKEGSKRYSVSDKIRDRITEPYLEVNLKYGGKQTQQVFTNFFFMTNHPDALVLTNQDRRINVFCCPHAPKPESYYDRLYGWLESDGVNQLYNLLMNRDLSCFNWKRSMESEARTKMIHNNRTETEILFWDFMAEPPFVAMTFQQIVRHLRSMAEGDQFDMNIDEGQLNKLLQHHTEHSSGLKVEGKKIRPWILQKGQELKNKAVREEILRCGL